MTDRDRAMRDVNAQVLITSNAAGLTIRVGPAVATAVASLFDSLFIQPGNAPGGPPTASMTPTERVAYVRSELDRAINDPSLTEQQRAELQQLLPMYEALEQFLRDSYDRAPSQRAPEAQDVFLRFFLPRAAAAGAAAGGAAGGTGNGSGNNGGYDPRTDTYAPVTRCNR